MVYEQDYILRQIEILMQGIRRVFFGKREKGAAAFAVSGALPGALWYTRVLERLEAGVSAQEAQLRALTRQVGQLPTQAQLEALARNVAQIRETLKQAGRRREISISPPSLETAFSVLIWLILILLGTMVGMVALQTIWSGLAALWSAIRILLP